MAVIELGVVETKEAREMSKMINEANSRPISFSDDIVQRVLPFHDHSIQKYGMKMSYSLSLH